MMKLLIINVTQHMPQKRVSDIVMHVTLNNINKCSASNFTTGAMATNPQSSNTRYIQACQRTQKQRSTRDTPQNKEVMVFTRNGETPKIQTTTRKQ